MVEYLRRNSFPSGSKCESNVGATADFRWQKISWLKEKLIRWTTPIGRRNAPSSKTSKCQRWCARVGRIMDCIPAGRSKALNGFLPNKSGCLLMGGRSGRHSMGTRRLPGRSNFWIIFFVASTTGWIRCRKCAWKFGRLSTNKRFAPSRAGHFHRRSQPCSISARKRLVCKRCQSLLQARCSISPRIGAEEQFFLTDSSSSLN